MDTDFDTTDEIVADQPDGFNDLKAVVELHQLVLEALVSEGVSVRGPVLSMVYDARARLNSVGALPVIVIVPVPVYEGVTSRAPDQPDESWPLELSGDERGHEEAVAAELARL